MSSGLKEQKISKTERPDRIRKVSDARVLPKFIMFDGEGNYQRKIINGMIRFFNSRSSQQR